MQRKPFLASQLACACLTALLLLNLDFVLAQSDTSEPLGVCQRATLKLGSEGDDVLHAQRQLREFGGRPGSFIKQLNGRFNKDTHYAVLAYQKMVFPDSKAEHDGVIGIRTWRSLGCGDASASMAPPDPVSSLVDDIECKRPRLMWGSHGRDVLHAQRQLKKFGGKPAEYLGKIDGEYGDRMRNAVVAYQQIVFPAEPRLPRGVISLETWDKLGCGANSTPKGAPPKRWLDTLDSLK